MEPLVVQLKYGPWRGAAVRAWKRHRGGASHRRPASSAQRAQVLLKVLTETAKEVNKEKVPRAWARHAGRSVGHHSGGVNVLRHMGVLITAEGAGMSFRADGADSDSEEEEVGEEAEVETQWRLHQTTAERDAAVHKLQRFIEGWDAIRGAFTTAPTTCQEWCDKVAQGLEGLRALSNSVPRLPRPAAGATKEKYTTLWTFRGCMMLRMHQAGRRKLEVGAIPLRAFCRMNPDENENLLRIVNANRRKIFTTSDLLQHCGVSGVQRPEYLSAELCLAGDRGLDSLDHGEADTKLWRAEWQTVKAKDGLSPHIACVAKAVRQRHRKHQHRQRAHASAKTAAC